MKLSELTIVSDSFTDEEQTQTFALSYANQALSIINSEVGLILPSIVSTTADYPQLERNWFHRLIGFFLMYGVKMNDGSLNEAREYKEWFMQGLNSFREVAIGDEDDGGGGLIDPEYIDQNALGSRYARLDTDEFVSSWFNR